MKSTKCSIALLYVLAPIMASGCIDDIDYKAKYCGFTSVSFYVLDDLTTHYVPQYGAKPSLDDPDVESGFTVKKEYESYIEYNGSMNFVALKDPTNRDKIPNYEISFGTDHYVVESQKSDGIIRRYHIDFDGSLFRIDQVLTASDGEQIVLKAPLCGGKFQVD